MKSRAELASLVKEKVPGRAGVYLFYDKDGGTMYVGKSVNLRRRMLSYFARPSANTEDRVRQMVFNVAGFEYHETGTELLALLLEDALIKRHLPPFNARQKEFLKSRYLAANGRPLPGSENG